MQYFFTNANIFPIKQLFKFLYLQVGCVIIDEAVLNANKQSRLAGTWQKGNILGLANKEGKSAKLF